MKRSRLWATDHRALLLEAVATSPKAATLPSITADLESATYSRHMIAKMFYQLRKEGLIGIRTVGEEPVLAHGEAFITQTGMDWLLHGRFDRQLPEPGRPRRRRKKELRK